MEHVRPVRPGWVLPIAGVVGVLVGVWGFLLAHGQAPVRSLCHVFASGDALLKGVGGSTPPTVPNCTSPDVLYNLGRLMVLVGSAAALVAILALARRGRRAAVAGAPWRTRRATDSVARWLDARLPGRTHSQPRLRGGYLLGLAAALAVVGVTSGASAWQSHRQAAKLHAYNIANAALADLRLPAAIEREPSSTCGSPVCARSQLMPPQVEPYLLHLLSGTPEPALSRLLGCAGPCPINVQGQIDGYPVVAIAFWHLLIVRHGKPPKGAIPDPSGHREVFYRGSDIYIGPASPNPDS